ncbi:pilus assembly PilX family protein [Cupriavidus campinensis]
MLTTRLQGGMAMIAFVTTMLVLTGGICVAAMHFLHAGRQLAGLHLDREIAFRAAEVALRDAEADLMAATASVQGRLAEWPASGSCGTQAQRGICRAGSGQPAWQPWLDGAAPESTPGLALGTITGARMPQLPNGVAGATRAPWYLIEILDDHNDHPHTPGAAAHWPRFRITALGLGRDPSVRVLLQAEFQP